MSSACRKRCTTGSLLPLAVGQKHLPGAPNHLENEIYNIRHRFLIKDKLTNRVYAKAGKHANIIDNILTVTLFHDQKL